MIERIQPPNPKIVDGYKPLHNAGFRLYMLKDERYNFTHGEQIASSAQLREMLLQGSVNHMLDQREGLVANADTPERLAEVTGFLQHEIEAIHGTSLSLNTEMVNTLSAKADITGELVDYYANRADILMDKKIMASERGFVAYKARMRYEMVFSEISKNQAVAVLITGLEGTPKQKLIKLLEHSDTPRDIRAAIVNMLTGDFTELNGAAISETLNRTMESKWGRYRPETPAPETFDAAAEDAPPSAEDLEYNAKHTRAVEAVNRALQNGQRLSRFHEAPFLSILGRSTNSEARALHGRYSGAFVSS